MKSVGICDHVTHTLADSSHVTKYSMNNIIVATNLCHPVILAIQIVKEADYRKYNCLVTNIKNNHSETELHALLEELAIFRMSRELLEWDGLWKVDYLTSD